MSDYRPISCDAHSVLEVLALRRSRVDIECVDSDTESRVHSGRVVDILTRAGAEYLVVESGSQRLDLRLDRLRTIRDIDGVVLWGQKTDETG
jgi:transcriptional antiterminator Rof (Rho-off)